GEDQRLRQRAGEDACGRRCAFRNNRRYPGRHSASDKDQKVEAVAEQDNAQQHSDQSAGEDKVNRGGKDEADQQGKCPLHHGPPSASSSASTTAATVPRTTR